MFKKIMWATDGSDASDLALPAVKELAGELGAAVVVFHADQRLVGPRTYGMAVNVDEEEVKDKIRRQADELGSGEVDVSLSIVSDTGQPAHAIAAAAAKESVELIVAGTRGHTKLGGLLLGSVTHRLLQIAPCTVLIVPVSAARKAPAAEAAAVAGFPQ